MLRAIRNTLRRFAVCERGTQLVELAIVLPVMMTLMAATAELGRFFYTYSTLTKVTRSAARYLASADVQASSDVKAQNLAVYGNTEGTGEPLVYGLSTGNVWIERTGAVGGFPEKVSVGIEGFTYEPLFDIGKFIGKPEASLNISLEPRTTMRYLKY